MKDRALGGYHLIGDSQRQWHRDERHILGLKSREIAIGQTANPKAY